MSRLKYIIGDYNGARFDAMTSLKIIPGDRETLNSHAAAAVKLNVRMDSTVALLVPTGAERCACCEWLLLSIVASERDHVSKINL